MAIESFDIDAMNDLGDFYNDPNNTKKITKKAFMLFTKSC